MADLKDQIPVYPYTVKIDKKDVTFDEVICCKACRKKLTKAECFARTDVTTIGTGEVSMKFLCDACADI